MKPWFVTVVLCWCGWTSAQEYPRQDVNLNQLADEWYGVPDQDLDYSDLYENLAQLLAHPLNLNTASEEDLRFIKILSESQIKNLVTYRRNQGNFISVYELQAVPGFDVETLHRVAPFVFVTDPTIVLDKSFLGRIRTQSNNYLLVRYGQSLQRAQQYSAQADSASRFTGSPGNLYVRFRSSRPGDFSFGFTAEKDAGEPWRWNPSQHYYGADYFSFHAQVQNKGRLKNLVLGDYQSQFGQGLMLGGIFGIGKGGETITTVRRTNIGVLPYTSVYEAGYLRGAAATVEVNRHVQVTGFYSHKRRDAAVLADADDAFISSFQNTGLHRTEKEMAARHQIGDQSWGGVVQFKTGTLDAGIMYNRVDFGVAVHPNPAPYNQFAFSGSQNQNVGGFVNYTFQNITFFSEYARSLNGGAAGTAGVLWSLSPQLDVSMLFRKFASNFYAFYSNAFAEGSTTQNEEGFYGGWKYKPSRRWTMAGYIDLFRFPWLRFRSYAPSAGHEGLLRVAYQPSRTVVMFVEAREEVKARNVSNTSPLYATADGTKRLFRFNIEYGVAQSLHLKTRGQLSTFSFQGKQTQGFALLQDLGANLGPLEVTARYALFDTDDYDNRQYVYENDVWLAYSMPAYYGRGVRKVLMVQYKVSRALTVWLRYGYTRYADRQEIESSAGTIAGNVQNDIKFQLRITF